MCFLITSHRDTLVNALHLVLSDLLKSINYIIDNPKGEKSHLITQLNVMRLDSQSKG